MCDRSVRGTTDALRAMAPSSGVSVVNGRRLGDVFDRDQHGPGRCLLASAGSGQTRDDSVLRGTRHTVPGSSGTLRCG